MYKYEFVRIPIGGFFVRKPTEDYKAVIDSYAAKGWRLVQIFTPETTSNGGTVDFFELIFEMKED